MKILILSSQAKNTGSALRAFYIYKFLKKAGAQAYFIEPPFKSMDFMIDFFLSFFYYFFKIFNKKYDLVIIVKPYPNTVIPCMLLKAKGTKIIIDIDDMDHGYRKSIISGFIKFLQKILIPVADMLTSHNKELIKLIIKNFPQYKEKIYYLKQCVDLTVFKPYLRRNKLLQDKYTGKKILFYMANMNIASYFEDILVAISKIKLPYVLFAVGGGPLFSYYLDIVKKLNLKERVIFLGPCDLKTTAEYLSIADICLVYYRDLPVNKYRASMKLREYLALNKPVVANNVGEIKDFKDYIYMSGSTLSSFTFEIKKRIKYLDKRQKKGYKFIYGNYNWDKEAKKFYRFILFNFKKNKIQ